MTGKQLLLIIAAVIVFGGGLVHVASTEGWPISLLLIIGIPIVGWSIEIGLHCAGIIIDSPMRREGYFDKPMFSGKGRWPKK